MYFLCFPMEQTGIHEHSDLGNPSIRTLPPPLLDIPPGHFPPGISPLGYPPPTFPPINTVYN